MRAAIVNFYTARSPPATEQRQASHTATATVSSCLTCLCRIIGALAPPSSNAMFYKSPPGGVQRSELSSERQSFHGVIAFVWRETYLNIWMESGGD